MRGSIRAVRRLWEYCLLAVDIWRARRSELIIVREFSTYYLLVTAGLCLPLMRRVALVVNHNVQAAHNSALQRRLLILFAR
ncbi:MAG: hypothetical protein JW990_09905, partial [Thermoleophilia bacterium]|nr:hypothetical protein [Thermoleophilia bacterium]